MEMIRFWWKNHLKTVAAARQVFGAGEPLVRALLGKPAALCLDQVCGALDDLFFPSYRHQKIESPVFIIGHPRSGSTFLHRFLHQTNEFVCFRFWEILFPSLTARTWMAPLIQKRIRQGRNVVLPPETGHDQNLESVEEEELLFFKYLNTQFILPTTPLAFSDVPCDDLVFADQLQSTRLMSESMKYLRQCFQKQMLWTGKKRIIANMNYSAMRLKGLLKEFPDAKVIYLIRSPYETIASHLTLHYHVIDYNWGIGNIPKENITAYFEQRYRYNVAYYLYVEHLLDQGVLDGSRTLVVRYDSMKTFFRELMKQLFAFMEIEMSGAHRTAIEKQALAQRKYRPVHHNFPLETFGISRKRVAMDLGCIFERYHFDVS